MKNLLAILFFATTIQACQSFFPKPSSSEIEVRDSDRIVSFSVDESSKSAQQDLVYYYYFNQKIHSSRGNYLGKVLDGNYKEYNYSDGQILIKGFFNKGLKDKQWFFYNAMGKLIRMEEWKNGSLKIRQKNDQTVKLATLEENDNFFSSLKASVKKIFRKDSIN